MLRFSFIFLLVGSFIYAGELTRTFDVPADRFLSVDIKSGGSVFVTGWDKNSIEVKVEFRGRELDEYSYIDFDDRSSGLFITAGAEDDRRQDFRFNIQLPKKFDLEMTTMGGTISVEDIQGKLEGETMGGQIHLRNLKGNIDFTTMGGNINLSNSDVDGEVSTMGGQVLFDNVIGDVDGSSMGGNVIYKNVRSRDGKRDSGRSVNISTMGGDIEVDEALNGADVSTMGGDIDVNKAASFVKATTMGGTIDIREIDGWVKASTMGGDVYVNMTGEDMDIRRDVNISSMGGDIELALPAEISADFSIRLTYTKNSRGNYEIESDFPLKIEEDEEWSYRHGDPRKIIRGTGEVKEGKNTIRVETVNGNITIKKK